MICGRKVGGCVFLLALACAGMAWGKGEQHGPGSHGGNGGGFSHSSGHAFTQFSHTPRFQGNMQTHFSSDRRPSVGNANRNNIYSDTHSRPTYEPRQPSPSNPSHQDSRFTGFQRPPSHDNHFQSGQNGRTPAFHNDRSNFTHTFSDGTHLTRSHGRIELTRPNGTRTVRSNNVLTQEREFDRDHRVFVQRTYIHNNFVSVRDYRVSYWGHHRCYAYVPYYVYPRPFYGWFWHPWGPVAYSWSWYGDPWFDHYGYYWEPYRVYYGPSFWVTDFVIADTLSRSYSEDAAAEEAGKPTQAVMNEKIKTQVRKEVESELKAREKQQSVPIEKTLKKGHVHVFTKDMDVAVAGSDESCSLTSGDIAKVSRTPSKDEDVVDMTVITSKKGGCGPNKHVLVSLDDLQDMKNQFSESIDKGLEKLQEQQGKNGLPAAPKAAQTPPQETLTPEEKDRAVHDAKDAAKQMETDE